MSTFPLLALDAWSLEEKKNSNVVLEKIKKVVSFMGPWIFLNQEQQVFDSMFSNSISVLIIIREQQYQ